MQLNNKTISEIAETSRKSKRTIYNHLDKIKETAGEDLETYLIVIDKIQYLTPRGQLEIYKSLGDTRNAKKVQMLLDEAGTPQVEQKEDKGTTSTSEYIETLKSQIKDYKEQVEAQNKRIDKLLEIVDTQSKKIALDSINKEKDKKYIEAGYNDTRHQEEKKTTLIEKIKNIFK